MSFEIKNKIPTDVLKRFCEGDNEAITEVFVNLKETVLGWASSYISDNFKFHDAEQAASEVWLKVLKTKSSLKDPSTAVSFIKRVTNNQCLDMLRKISIRKEESMDQERADSGMVRNTIECNRFVSPEDALVKKEELKTLRSLVASLDPIYFEALNGFLEGRSYAAIAEMCDCPLGTVQRRIFHARKLIMERSENLRGG